MTGMMPGAAKRMMTTGFIEIAVFPCIMPRQFRNTWLVVPVRSALSEYQVHHRLPEFFPLPL